jgi:hypothetical protein
MFERCSLVFIMAKIDHKGGDKLLLEANETTYLTSLIEDDQEGNGEDVTVSLPLWTEVDIDGYHKKRSCLTKWLVGGHPT